MEKGEIGVLWKSWEKRPWREGQGRSPLTISVSLLKMGPLAKEPAAPQAAALVLVRLAMNQLIDQTVGIQATLRGPPTRLTRIRLYQVPCAQLCLTLCHPMDCSLTDSCLLDSPGKNTGVVCHFLLEGIFPAQGSHPHLLHLLLLQALFYLLRLY